MTVYEVPATSPYQWAFRILASGAIGMLMGILIFSFYEPAGINDSTNHPLGWLAVAIVLAAIVGTTIFGMKEGSWKLMRMLRFEISDGQIIEPLKSSRFP
jgi:branched-subunit amino acid transport protein